MLPDKQHIAGTVPAKKPTTVAQTCNQLSLFLKKKGCLRDLHLGFNPKSDDTAARMTIDLLSNMENPDQNNAQTEKLMNLPADSGRSAAASESKTAQMTIFYDGQVIVLDDIPADRARDVMSAAGNGAGAVAGDYRSSTGKTEDRVKLTTKSTHPSNERVQANGLDLPIARRASLHKFLSKRKDRATVRAPYQLQDPSPEAGPSKQEHNFDLNI